MGRHTTTTHRTPVIRTADEVSGPKVVFIGRAHRIEHTEGIGELVPHPVDLAELVRAVERAISEDRERGTRFQWTRVRTASFVGAVAVKRGRWPTTTADLDPAY
jgi:hypothetical protein